MYQCCYTKGEVIIIINDTTGGIFGGLIFPGIEKRERFYGTGECLLFRWNETKFERYLSTSKNEFYVFIDSDGLGQGSEPEFGYFVMNDMVNGYTSDCLTYGNPPLTGKKGKF